VTTGFLKHLTLILAGVHAYGQSAVPTPREFDVVSIKPYVPKGPISEACNPRGDPVMLTRTGCTLEDLVQEAYDLKSYQVHLKGAGWIETDRYVLQTRLATPASVPEMMKMLKPVLASRFHLFVHWEDREAPVYLLQAASHGTKLADATKKTQCGSVFARPGILKSDCLSMDDVAEVLQEFVFKDRPVLNQTGLNKDHLYQLTLQYSEGDDPDHPSIFTALPDQLGLTLKAGKAPIKTRVIDSAQRPEEN
jgi:uncharacterized protein (TIGR03435 family)